MRIAMVADSLAHSDATWAQPPLPALSGALSAAGHDVTVYIRDNARDAPGEDTADGGFRLVRTSSATRSKRSAGQFADALVERWRADPPDLVHGHSSFGGGVALRAAARLGLPVVYSADESGTVADELAVVTAAQHVVVPYTGQRQRLLRSGMSHRKVSVVPYGLDVEVFTPEGDRAEATAARRIVTVGALEPDSGFGTAVGALVGLRDTELVVVGGPVRSRYAGELRQYARTLGVADRLTLAGAVPHAELPALLRSADLVVCSPWTESFGIGAVEAMACGVPVVANGMGGLADTVVHRVTGVQVAPRRPRELAAALRRLLAERMTREHQGAAGRDRAASRYPWAFIAAETAHVYRGVLSGT